MQHETTKAGAVGAGLCCFMLLRYTSSIPMNLSPLEQPKLNLDPFSTEFLGDIRVKLPDATIKAALAKSETASAVRIAELFKEHAVKRAVSYDSQYKTFSVKNERDVTAGTIIAARRLGLNISFPAFLDNFAAGKQLRETLKVKIQQDIISEELNKSLAGILAKEMKNKDTSKAEGYTKIMERSGKKSEQIGVQAEEIVMGVLESIAIDRPELGLTVSPANAYQDVEEKIDFIIATNKNKRGVGVDSVEMDQAEKHIGIQFTTNLSSKIHKEQQIANSKARGIDVDDILYVSIDMEVLKTAIKEWEEDKKPIKGPWTKLPQEIRTRAIQELFKSILNEEQIQSLVNV